MSQISLSYRGLLAFFGFYNTLRQQIAMPLFWRANTDLVIFGYGFLAGYGIDFYTAIFTGTLTGLLLSSCSLRMHSRSHRGEAYTIAEWLSFARCLA